MASVYISDKAVVEVVPYIARSLLFRLDVGPFVLIYLVIYYCIWHLGEAVLQGWGKALVLVALPTVLAAHFLVFLGTKWSVRFCCMVSKRRLTSINLAEVMYEG